MKKVLSIITVLTMLLACIYVPAAAADLGSYENPYRVTANSLTPTKITLPPDSGSIYVFVDNSDNTVLTVGEATNNLYQLYYCRLPVTIENDGTTSFTMVEEAGFFVLMNPTDSQIVVSMRLEGSSAPQPIGTIDKPEELSPVASGDGFAISKTQALADGNEGYYYSLSAPCNGTMNVKISAQGSAGTPVQWAYVINNISTSRYGEKTFSEPGAAETSADITVSTGNHISILVETHDPANEWHNPAGTVNVAITFIPKQSDDTSGGSTAPEVNYVISDTRLTKGTKSYTISKDKDYTVFIFSSDEIGKYTIRSINSSMGIVSTNGMSITTTPSAESVCVGSLKWTCTGAGQSIWVAVRSRSDAVEITVEGENLQTNDSTKEYYENKHVPSPFTFSGNAAALTYVNTKDASVDKAVLGDDGFYHLNSADGPILYADLDDSRISIEEANSYGQLKHFEYEGEKLVKTVDYSLAMASYIENMDKNTGLYPLTEDLMEVFSKVGTGNGWYGADGWVGGELEDSWMFACCYQGEGNDSSSGNEDNTDDSSSSSDENYVVDYDHPLAEGDGQYPLSKDKEYTVFPFAPTSTGKYTFSATNASIALVSNNGMWITVEPSKVTVSSGNFEWTCISEGQEIWVAARGSEETADISITREDSADVSIPKENYENKHTPQAFTYDGDASLLQYVNIEDGIVDTAVLGDDGFYHLNSADGPILYADLNDEIMSLEDANSYGQLTSIVYENSEPVKTVDYTLAMTDYLNSMDKANGLYPLTEDLIEIFQKVGESQYWYGDNGGVGGTEEDAWMFACYYYVPGTDAPAGGNDNTPDASQDNNVNTENNESSQGGQTGGSTTSPQTGDEMVYIALVAVLAIGAFALLTVIRRRRFNK